MALGDDIAAVLPELQHEAESMMLDECVITRTGAVLLDRRTGKTSTESLEVWRGRCRLRTTDIQATQLGDGLVAATLQTGTLSLPVSAASFVHAEDVVTIVASRAAHLVGKSFAVRAVPTVSLATAARYRVQEVAT